MMVSNKSVMVLVALCLLATTRSLQAQSPNAAVPAADANPVLRSGDLIKITVWRKEELSGEFLIGANGAIQHPLYEDIHVGGLPLSDVRKKVYDFLVAYGVDPKFVIEPQLAVAVGGEVRQPGLFNLPPGATVSRAIALAGPTERARFDAVRLIRDGSVTVLNLANPSTTNSALPVQSGDQIIVPVRREIWRDYIVPSASLLAGLAAVATAVIK